MIQNIEQNNQLDYFMNSIKNFGVQAVILQEDISHQNSKQLRESKLSDIRQVSLTTEENNLDFSEIDMLLNPKNKTTKCINLDNSPKTYSGSPHPNNKKILIAFQAINDENERLKADIIAIKGCIIANKELFKKLINKFANYFKAKVQQKFVSNQKMAEKQMIKELTKKNQELLHKNYQLINQINVLKEGVQKRQKSKQKDIEVGVNAKLRYLNTIQKFSKQIQLLEEQIRRLKANQKQKEGEFQDNYRKLLEIEDRLLEKERELGEKEIVLFKKQEQIFNNIQILSVKFQELKEIEEKLFAKSQQINDIKNSYPQYNLTDERNFQDTFKNKIKFRKHSAMDKVENDVMEYEDIIDYDQFSPDRRFSLNQPFGQRAFKRAQPQILRTQVRPQMKIFNKFIHNGNYKQKTRLNTSGPYQSFKHTSKSALDDKISYIQNNLRRQLQMLKCSKGR